VCTAAGNQSGPILISDGTGGVIAAWLDRRDNATTGQDVYAAKLYSPGVVAVPLPSSNVLELAPARPNPSAGPLTLVFVLPSDSPARIDVLDVSGRRVWSQSVVGAGRHVLALNDDLVPGVYVVQLTHEGRVVTTRAVRSR
jgi:hypothetical protein